MVTDKYKQRIADNLFGKPLVDMGAIRIERSNSWLSPK